MYKKTSRLTFPIETEGKRKKKNWLSPEMTIAKIRPSRGISN